jgi:hypothetical protein
MTSSTPLTQPDAFDSRSGKLYVIIETPKGSRNKFKYDEELGLFKLAGAGPEPRPGGRPPRREGERLTRGPAVDRAGSRGRTP